MEAKLALCLILAIMSAEWYGVESFRVGAPLDACINILAQLKSAEII